MFANKIMYCMDENNETPLDLLSENTKEWEKTCKIKEMKEKMEFDELKCKIENLNIVELFIIMVSYVCLCRMGIDFFELLISLSSLNSLGIIITTLKILTYGSVFRHLKWILDHQHKIQDCKMIIIFFLLQTIILKQSTGTDSIKDVFTRWSNIFTAKKKCLISLHLLSFQCFGFLMFCSFFDLYTKYFHMDSANKILVKLSKITCLNVLIGFIITSLFLTAISLWHHSEGLISQK